MFWVRPHQYWWRRTHGPLLKTPLGGGALIKDGKNQWSEIDTLLFYLTIINFSQKRIIRRIGAQPNLYKEADWCSDTFASEYGPLHG